MTSMIGVYFFSVTVVGYFSRLLGLGPRCLLAAAGIGAMTPHAALDQGVWVNIGAIALGIAILLRERLAGRRLKEATAGEVSP